MHKLPLYIFIFFLLVANSEFAMAQYYSEELDTGENTSDSVSQEELQAEEGGQQGQMEEEIIVIEKEELPWIAMQEPPKSKSNKLRVTYEEGSNDIGLEDKIAIDSMIKLTHEEGLNFNIYSYSAKNTKFENSLSFSILRLQKLATYLKSKGFDYQENNFYAYPAEENEYDLNYIDIDKL